MCQPAQHLSVIGICCIKIICAGITVIFIALLSD